MEHIVDLWPSLTELARDLDKPVTTVSSWKLRGSIPAKFDLDLIAAAERRGVTLTLEQIAAARRRKAG